MHLGRWPAFRAARAVTAAAALIALLPLSTACGGGSRTGASAARSTAVAVAAAPPTASPTRTPAPAPSSTPMPTPSPTPSPTPAATATALAVQGPPPAPTPFPTPPPRQGALPPNASGIARFVAPGLIRDLYVEIVHVVDNQMQAPTDGEYSVGWYPEYGRPGTAGNAVFAAHQTWNHFQGPFYELHLAEPGDPISIEMTDGTTYRYRVISRHRYSLKTIPMQDILWPPNRPPDAQWITLMTCGGRIVYNSTGFGEFLDRDVIVAERVQ